MSQKEILAIAIKVFSLWFLCWLFIQVATFIPFLTSLGIRSGHEVPSWAFLVICASFLASGFIIAKVLFSISSSALNRLSDEKDIFLSDTGQKYILQVFGFVFIASSLTWLPSSLYFLISPETREIHFHFFLKPFGHVLQLAIGTWLIAHPSWWTLLFSKLRGRA